MSQSLLLLLATIARALNESSPCYHPNGRQINDAGYTPCNLAANVSHCCKASDTCISNGYCFQQGGQREDWNLRIARSSCTDQTFNSSSCPQRCKDVSISTDMAMILVNNSEIGEFCCSAEYDTQTGLCGSATLGSDQPFELEPGQIIWDRNNGDADFRNIYSATVTTTAIPQATSASEAPGSISIVPIVVGITVPLGILLLLALVAASLFWKRMKRKQRHISDDRVGEKSSDTVSNRVPLASAPSHEVDTRAIYEASPETQAHELKAAQDPVEIGQDLIEIAGSPIHLRR